jgi:predicted DCC family thiol-disulfide oxidoreductase YuxK
VESEADNTPQEANLKLPSNVPKPIFVYDGECGFCKFWIDRWKRTASDDVIFKPYQHLPRVYNGIRRREFKKTVYLITQHRRLRGAAAVFEMLALGGNNFWNQLYYNLVLADVIFEAGYWLIATHRDFFFMVIKLFNRDAKKYETDTKV